MNLDASANADINYEEEEESDDILAFELPKPILSKDANERGSYTSFFMSSFSVSQGIEKKFSDMLDLPKWNETTFMAQFHESLAASIAKSTGMRVLRAPDVVLHAVFWANKNRGGQLSDEILKLHEGYNAFEGEGSEIYRINASFFFTMLFTDTEFNTRFNIEDKILIGNALTFAIWKERMECDLIIHSKKKNLFDEGGFVYDESHDNQDKFFSEFCSNRLVDSPDTRDRILKISPWCGFAIVIKTVEEKLALVDKRPKGKGIHRLLRYCISIMVTNDFLTKVKGILMHTDSKRIQEDQYFLALILSHIAASPRRKDTDLKLLIHEIRQILYANVAVDTQGGIELYTMQGMDMLDKLRTNPKVLHEMKKINEDLTEYISNTLSSVVSKTGEKLMHKTINYFVFIPFAIQIMRLWQNKGMFASLHYVMDSTLGTITKHLPRVNILTNH